MGYKPDQLKKQFSLPPPVTPPPGPKMRSSLIDSSDSSKEFLEEKSVISADSMCMICRAVRGQHSHFWEMNFNYSSLLKWSDLVGSLSKVVRQAEVSVVEEVTEPTNSVKFGTIGFYLFRFRDSYLGSLLYPLTLKRVNFSTHSSSPFLSTQGFSYFIVG